MTSRAQYLATFALGCAIAACGAQSKPQQDGEGYGGETNWLQTCTRDAQCPDSSCLCGVCTVRCDRAADCAKPFGGMCAMAGNEAFGELCNAAERVDGLCLPRCASNRECGDAFSCRDGACVPKRDPLAGLIDSATPSGWRDSTEPLCAQSKADILAADVWSSDSHVVVTARSRITGRGSAQFVDNSCVGTACELVTVLANDGQGWTVLMQAEAPPGGDMSFQLAGKGGAPVLWSSDELAVTPEPCRLGWLDATTGTFDCETSPLPNFRQVFAAGSGLIYGLGNSQVVRYDGSSWGPLPADPAPTNLGQARALWGDGDVVFGGGELGLVLSWRDGSWHTHDTRTLDNITALWGFADDDVWAGTVEGRFLHYDGTRWTERGQLGCEAIRELWGSEGVLYARGDRSIARHDGSQLEMLTTIDCDIAFGGPVYFGLWGNSPTEVFVLADTLLDPGDGCGSLTVLRYDGSAFHRM